MVFVDSPDCYTSICDELDLFCFFRCFEVVGSNWAWRVFFGDCE